MDRDGCPLDSDGDGVPDYKDLCPNTPKGIRVDEYGCPLDSDGDGIPDYLDKCPNTPLGVQVDSNGCPLDSDHDGVPDYLDKCPDTAPGTKVDSTGCPVKTVPSEEVNTPVEEPVKEAEVMKVTLSVAANFVSGKTKLLPASYAELDKIVKIMREQPASRWNIAGYTDNKISDKLSKSVSLARANSVFNYFLSKGINRKRFQVTGSGKSLPIAPNNTEQGRAKNRRVEITRIN